MLDGEFYASLPSCVSHKLAFFLEVELLPIFSFVYSFNETSNI